LIADIGSIATAVAVIAAALSLRQTLRLRIRAFEDPFRSQFWAIIDSLTLKALDGSGIDQPGDSDLSAAYRYFHLCENQLNLRATGWVSDSSWATWVKGIDQWMTRWPFDWAWKHQPEPHHDHFPGLVKFMAVTDKSSYDPCQMTVIRRWVRGLL